MMSQQSYLATADLPPKPDPASGEPRPPRAPGGTSTQVPKEQDKERESNPAKTPNPPAGQGAVLAWYAPSRRREWGVGATAYVMLVLGVTLMQGFDLRWMSLGWPWLALAVFAVLIAWTVRGSTCSAGAEWVQRRRTWVRLYELKKITAHWRSNAVHLDFEDQDGRVLKMSASDLQRDPDVWDLVYNGILHSVIAGGAETNGRLHSALRVPRPWPHQQ